MARENMRQQTTAPPLPAKGNGAVPNGTGGNEDTDDQAMMSPDDIGQQQQQEQERQMMQQQQGEFPMHEVNADPQRYPVDQATQLHSFLKNAAGGTGTFVTANKDSHEMAKQLARSGHLQHQGSRLGGAGGGLRHVWSLTSKGMAAIGQDPKVAKQKAGMGQFGPQRPGMSGQKPGGGKSPQGGQFGGMQPRGGSGGGGF
jgi:hypothetical protein